MHQRKVSIDSFCLHPIRAHSFSILKILNQKTITMSWDILNSVRQALLSVFCGKMKAMMGAYKIAFEILNCLTNQFLHYIEGFEPCLFQVADYWPLQEISNSEDSKSHHQIEYDLYYCWPTEAFLSFWIFWNNRLCNFIITNVSKLTWEHSLKSMRFDYFLTE